MDIRSLFKQAAPLVCALLVIAAVVPILFTVDGRVATRQPIGNDPPYTPPVTATDPPPTNPSQPGGGGNGTNQASQPHQKQPFSWEWLKYVPIALAAIGVALFLLKFGSLIPSLMVSLWPLWVALGILALLALILTGVSSVIDESYIRPDPAYIQPIS